MINYCKDMWKRQSALLAPLTALSHGAKKHQKAPNAVKKLYHAKRFCHFQILISYSTYTQTPATYNFVES